MSADDPRFSSFKQRFDHREELEAIVSVWIGERGSEEVLRSFQEVDAAIAPISTMADVLADLHLAARDAIVEVDGVTMQGVAAKLSRMPGARFAGRAQGADAEAVIEELSCD